MDINKQNSRCNSRGGRQGLEIPNSYSEQFSDSASIKGMQHTIKGVNSPCEEENPQNIQTPDSGSTVREGDIDTLANPGLSTALSSPNSKKSASKQVSLSKIKPNSSSSKAIRDEQEIKKEDASLSPQNVSPLGFIPPGSGQPNCDNDDNNGTPTLNKSTNLSPLSCEKNVTFSRSGCSELEERPTSASLAISGNASTNLESGCGMLSTSISPKTSTDGFGSSVSGISNMPRNLNSFNGNLTKYNCSTQGESTQAMNSSGVGGEYMQQQNHVFVFSTQLANKSAEAVLGGQFPTIIAYHCMQPSTKLFLEDFLKNPSKSSKLQRQYSLNIMNVMQSGSSGPGPGPHSYWLNDCNSSGKFSHRLALRNVGVNKNNPNWGDQAPVLENQGCATSNSLDILNNSEAFDNSKSSVCGIKVEDKLSIPSLQGVKVPDENLTPQQRQHREEQLAKLKKMNEFLFPENESNEFQPGNGNNSAPSESTVNSLAASSVEMMHNSGGPCTDGSNKLYQPSMRNIAGNLGKQSGQGATNLDSITGGLVGESGMSTDMMTTGGESASLGSMQPIKQGCIPKINAPNMNMIKSRGHCDVTNEQSNSTGLETSPDMTSSFNINKNCPTSSESETVGGPSNTNIPHEEWGKFQNNAFHQEGFKNRHLTVNQTAGMTGGSGSSIGGAQNTSLSRSLSIGVAGYGMQQNRPNTGPSSTNRNNSGPPPPYHQTQRSASVPIATQSPTHANSNNTNTDMPSPQGGSRVPFGVSSTPPNTDVTNSSSVITNPTHSSSATTSLSGLSGGNVMSSSLLSSMATNPSPHSLSHISPRDIDCIESAHKLKRSSPQKFKGPLINDMPENTCMEAKYANFALNYPTCGMPPVNAQNMRQNMQQMSSQFCRRIDNIPLNPNCSRVGQNKTSSGFDPISSLAQMSQQLTGCGVGLSTLGAGGNGVTGGLMDVNSGEMMGGPSGRSNDHSMDHCNQMSNANNIGMSGLVGALGRPPGQYAPDINNMLCGEPGSMDQRMLNGKMCVPNFNPNSLNGVGGMRDSNIGCNDMMPSSRPMNHRRMPSNFDNFNMSPNVHVKVSAPNTIQYMPARSQNLNNMRVPPSIEFFQRYSNHQAMGNVGGHPAGQHHVPNDIANNPNMMNLFGNCNQMSGVGQIGGGGSVGFEQNDLEAEGNVLPNDDYMNVR